jgi:hypothetical protein
MSIHRRDDRGGQYEVRWREGGRQRTRLFSKKGDAQAFELDIKHRRQLGPLAAGVIQSRVSCTTGRTGGGVSISRRLAPLA